MSDTPTPTTPSTPAAPAAGATTRSGQRKPRLLLVTGPWSSGTSAVAGMLDALGVNGLPPYFRTNDERTPVSFESIAFRNAILSLVSEKDLQVKATREQALAVLRALRARIMAGDFGPYDAQNPVPIFLKLPLSALLLPLICQVFDTQLLYVLRPLKGIEATRERRQWPEHFGAKGAQLIYGRMFAALVNQAFPTQLLRYPELVARPLQHARMLARLAGVDASPEQLEKAASFVRRAQAPAAGAAAAPVSAPAVAAAPAASAPAPQPATPPANKAASKTPRSAGKAKKS